MSMSIFPDPKLYVDVDGAPELVSCRECWAMVAWIYWNEHTEWHRNLEIRLEERA